MRSLPTNRAISLRLGPPQPLSPAYCLDEFACGEPVLDDWLKRRARANRHTGTSRTFVVADENDCVLGYYAMAAGAVAHIGRTQENLSGGYPLAGLNAANGPIVLAPPKTWGKKEVGVHVRYVKNPAGHIPGGSFIPGYFGLVSRQVRG